MVPTRRYGATGEVVSVIGIGGAFLHARSEAEGVAAVRRALELGVSYIDTSPAYGRGRSQAIVGEALRGQNGRFLLATKVGYLPQRTDYRSEDAIRRQIHENLELFGRDRVDVLQVHEADRSHWWSDDPSTPPRVPPQREFDFADAPVMRVLREAKHRGLCRYIGITGNSAAEMTRLLRALGVDTFLLAFNDDLLHRDAQLEALPLAQTKGVAVILGGVLRCGRLAEVHPEWIDRPPEWMTPLVREGYRRLYALQRDCGMPLPELTIRYLLRDPRPSTIMIGAETPSQVEQAAAAAVAGPLPVELHAALDGLVETTAAAH